MALTTGGLIEIADYNDLAFIVNRLFSDNQTSLGYYTSNIIINDTAPGGGYTAAKVFTPATNFEAGDFLVVTIDDLTLIQGTDYTVNSVANTITINDPIVAAAQTIIYKREEHRRGWGQQASVYPVTAGDPVLADEATLQAYIESNLNNLIDKTNVMTERTGSVVELTRIALGALIFATDTTTITSTINSELLSSTAYWNNDALATVTSSVDSFTRVADWSVQLVGVYRWTWADYDAMRYFFNSGGELRCNLEMTGDDQDAGYYNWNQVVTKMGALIMNYERATQTGTGGASTQIGSYELTPAYQTIFTSGSPDAPVTGDGPSPGIPGGYTAYGDYTNLVALFEARLQADTPAAGNVSIDIRVTLDDSSFLVQDISGTTTLNAGYKVADNITDNSAVFSQTANIPVITVVENFDSGNDS